MPGLEGDTSYPLSDEPEEFGGMRLHIVPLPPMIGRSLP